MDDVEAWLGLVGMLLFVGGWIQSRRDRSAWKRQMSKLPRFRFGRAIEGEEVRVRGVLARAAEGPLLEAPLSGRRCVGWRIVVERHDGVGQAGAWLPVRDESSICKVVIESENRTVLMGGNIVIRIEPSHEEGGNVTLVRSERALSYLADRGISMEGDRLRLAESVLETGQVVTIAGTLRHRVAPSGYRESGAIWEVGELSCGELWVAAQ